jgi:hypothetical protein
MRSAVTRANCLVAIGFIAAALASAASVTPARANFTAACAERDLKTVALIEEHGAADDLAASTLAEIGLAQLAARLSCVAGREGEALAIYDDVLRLDSPVAPRRSSNTNLSSPP